MPEIAFTDTGSYGPVIGDAEFEFIRHVVGENAGIVLGPNKRQLVQSRLARRLRELGLRSYQEYCEHIRSSGPEELVGLINALTTNVTAFFRENHHFEALAGYMLPEAMRRNASSRRIRIWSAGCSTGEEPYCVAMTAADVLPPAGWDFKILATDIDSDVIAFGQQGVYPLDRVASLPTERLRSCFQKGTGAEAGKAIVKAQLRAVVTFRVLNLLQPWPMNGPFDVIFCRNVMIYFDEAEQKRLIEKFYRCLNPEGYLLVGHAESLFGLTDKFRMIHKDNGTAYQRIEVNA